MTKGIGLIGALVGWVALGWAGAFFSPGYPDQSGFSWWRGELGAARWELTDLAGAGDHLFLEFHVWTREWAVPPPQELRVSLTASAMGRWTRTWALTLYRTSERGAQVEYSGQFTLPRRELDFGSTLCVQLGGWPAGVEVGVHPNSLRICSGFPVYASSPARQAVGEAGGPFVPLSSSPSDLAGRASPAPSALGIRECQDIEEAPYLAPGVYVGKLGWYGPGTAVDSKDWFRVNLRPSYILEISVDSPSPCSLSLLDPKGVEVGRISGFSQFGLTYQANIPGVYTVCLSTPQVTPAFSYTLKLNLAR